MEMSIQSTEQSEKIKLVEMPQEILERILIHLDYKNLLTTSHVCKLFASIAESAFARKNKNEYYRIFGYQETKVDRLILNKYGEKVQNIEIINREENLLDLVQEKCPNLKGLSLNLVSKVIMLQNLKEVSLGKVDNLDREKFLEFLNNNPDIESLKLLRFDVDLLSMLYDRLHMLKIFTLRAERNVRLLKYLPTMQFESLKSLELEFETNKANYYAHFLRAINCEKLEELILNINSDKYGGDDAIDEICKFSTLVSLRLPSFPVKSDQICKLVTHLSDLITLEVKIAEGEPDLENMIHSTISMLPKLTKLAIKLDDDNADRLSKELKSSVNDFHARYAKSNTKIKLDSDSDSVDVYMCITRDYLLSLSFDGDLFEIHWMENLNEKHVLEVMTEYCYHNSVKFVNNCADHGFNISTLGKGFAAMECLDFKSNGPIRVDSSVSAFLPHSQFTY